MISQLYTPIQTKKQLPFQTKEAKAIYDKTLHKIEQYFTHPQTKEMLQRFIHSADKQQLLTQIEQFKSLTHKTPLFLTKKTSLKAQSYSVAIVTENEELYSELKKAGKLTILINPKSKCEFVLDYDIIQAIECETTRYQLDQYDNVLFIDTIELLNPEQYLKKLDEYKESILHIQEEVPIITQEHDEELLALLKLLDQYNSLSVKTIQIDSILAQINNTLEQKLTLTSLSAFELLHYKNKNSLPPIITEIIEEIIAQTQIPPQCFTQNVPIDINKEAFKQFSKQKETEQILQVAKLVHANAEKLKNTQKILEDMHKKTLIYDFIRGINEFHCAHNAQPIKIHTELKMHNALNPHIKNAHAISYELTQKYPAALLTGANSGGKTTLLEHILTLCSLEFMGLNANGKIEIPKYDAIYYFAKNKGSANKGAFETMLLQLAQINTQTISGQKILVLADEMEAVTEPSVAAKVIAKTIDYFITQNCHCVFATHLGAILKDHIAENVRIDGIVAVGFDDNDNIIINHNPALNTLAASTPELIIQKLAKQHKDPFLIELAKAM
jgi:DNA mismatch repair protein MutS2